METGRVVTSLVKNVSVGDYLICQQDLGIEKISPNKAKLIRHALQQGL
jgi:hydrogenase maturation factor